MNSASKVNVFFYGSYINSDILKEAGFLPDKTDTAILYGFDISIRPFANLFISADNCVYGILTSASHAELNMLYDHAEEEFGSRYLPYPVLVRTSDDKNLPALCYIAGTLKEGNPEDKYIDNIINAAVKHNFPEWYIKKIESFKLKDEFK